jgi:hypothetical protein
MAERLTFLPNLVKTVTLQKLLLYIAKDVVRTVFEHVLAVT